MKKKLNNNSNIPKMQIAVVIAIIITVLSISIAYSSFYSNLYITGEVTLRADTSVRITGISLTSATNGAYESYKPLYNVDNFTINACLPNLDSEITYTVTFQNNSGSDIVINKLSSSVYDNQNISYTVSGIAINDIITANSSVDFTVTLKYNATSTLTDSICLSLVLDLGWEEYNNNPLTASINTLEGDTTSNDYGAPFVLTITNHSSSAVNYSLNSSSQFFNVYDESGKITTFTISGNTTENIKVYVKETSDSVFENTTQTTDLILNITSIDDSDPLTIGTLTLTLPELPKYTMISNGYTEESESDIDYSKTDSSGEGAVYKTVGTSGNEVYFYRGNVTNNYVTFAGYTWRILQIDEDGNLRVIMDGIIPSTTVKYRDTWSATSESVALDLVHYNNSNAKTTLDSWYETNIASNTAYSSRVVTSKFCVNTSYSNHTSSGTSSGVNYFQSYLAIGVDVAAYNPSLTCPDEYVITANIGLISAEEFVMAGGAYKVSNSNFFLYNSSITTNYWTLSPAYYDASSVNSVNVFAVTTDGSISDWTNTSLLTNSYALRPVLTLDGSYNAEGSGTSSDPYVY
jgi:hypothetical protein